MGKIPDPGLAYVASLGSHCVFVLKTRRKEKAAGFFSVYLGSHHPSENYYLFIHKQGTLARSLKVSKMKL